jgi:hypothetical protein
LHELDIQLESYLNQYSNISLVNGGLNKNFFKQVKHYESLRKDSFVWPLSISRESLANKQVFKCFRAYPKKIQYIRYVDHFILAIVGDKKCAFDVLIFIVVILDSLGMKLSIEKSGVKSPVKGIVFLGYHIFS